MNEMPGADHLTPLAFLDRPISEFNLRRQFEFQILLIQRINLFARSSNLCENGFVPPRC
jgi:hypothetical protein